MKGKSETKKIAKLVFQSIFVSGKVDETKLQKIVRIVKSSRSAQGKAILKYLEKMLQVFEKQNQLTLESAFNLSDQEDQQIKKTFEKFLAKDLKIESKENKDLIGGLKISNGDWVWEDSVVSKLNQLKGNFINE